MTDITNYHDIPEERKVNCGNCLMERVEIVELNADGTCPICDAPPSKEELKKKARERANKIRSARNQAMRDLGLVRVRGNLGGTYWE